MSEQNIQILKLPRNVPWMWYSLPAAHKRTDKRGQALRIRERVYMTDGQVYTVVRMGWNIERKRAVGIVYLR